jgi:two-component SAPR family response regulator
MSEKIELSGLTVLVLEDEYYIARALKRALTMVGAKVLGPFAREEEAIRCAERKLPDCALLDINLGFGPSFRTAAYLLSNGTPFVFLTAHDPSVIPQEFWNITVLQKPVEISDLGRAIETMFLSPRTTG